MFGLLAARMRVGLAVGRAVLALVRCWANCDKNHLSSETNLGERAN